MKLRIKVSKSDEIIGGISCGCCYSEQYPDDRRLSSDDGIAGES
jgi:hypothetical protein